MTEKPTKKEMYTEIGLSHDRGPSRDTGKATIVARRAKRVNFTPQKVPRQKFNQLTLGILISIPKAN